MKTHFVLALLLSGVAVAQSPGTFAATGRMITPRSGHTATLLLNGKVLLTGGASDARFAVSAELYDPSTGVFTRTGDMTTARYSNTATLLPSGKVLIAGGHAPFDESLRDYPLLTSAELYDPSTGTFTPTGSMAAFHAGATLLGNGKVLMTQAWLLATDGAPLRAELYDPGTGTFSLAGPFSNLGRISDPWYAQNTTMLADGKVLVTWEDLYSAKGGSELYDPGTDTFSMTGGMTQNPLDENSATLLMSGKVLYVGNYPDSDAVYIPADVEIYDPATGLFTNAGHDQNSHRESTATLLPDGTVLFAGGIVGVYVPNSNIFVCDHADSRAALYGPPGMFPVIGNMTTPRGGHTATLLSNGTVLMAGGAFSQEGCLSSGAATSSAELYFPAVLVPAPVLFSLSGDGRGQGAIWHAQTGQIASPGNPAVAGEALSMYTTSLAAGGVIPPQVSIGGRLAQVLYFGASGYPGYNQVNFLMPIGVPLGPAVSVQLTYLRRPSNAVTIGVR